MNNMNVDFDIEIRHQIETKITQKQNEDPPSASVSLAISLGETKDNLEKSGPKE